MKQTVKLEYALSDETVGDMVGTGSMAAGYWAEEIEWRPLAGGDGQILWIAERDDDLDGEGTPTWYQVTFAMLRDAFRKLATPGQDYVNSEIHGYFWSSIVDRDPATGEIDAGWIDGAAGDCLLQIACFDELRYG